MGKLIIAIDGPAASGKSTLARQLAAKYDFVFVNSGIFYRVYTWLALHLSLDAHDAGAMEALLREAQLVVTATDQSLKVTIPGTNVESELRSDAVNRSVAIVAQHPVIRDRVTKELRDLGERWDCVVEGRDIGTVIFPQTPFKIYLDGSLAIRAARRTAEGQVDDPESRDEADRRRAVAPLAAARDAIVIDISNRSIDEVFNEAQRILLTRRFPQGASSLAA